MYKTILVPLDGSKRAEAILSHIDLHQQEIERWAKQAESYLSTIQGEFQEKGIETKKHVINGPVVEAIIKVAEQEGADLIALASHGRSGLSQVFYGSVAAGVLHRIDRPLLLIRSRGNE
jgi:nucleotide-binding universal stress UspA family protein